MRLRELHHELSKDQTYVRAYDTLEGIAELSIHCRAIRADNRISQAQLVAGTDLTANSVSRFEHMELVEPWVISAIVHRLESGLRERGVDTARWMRVSPRRLVPPEQNKPHVDITSTVRGLASRPATLPETERKQVPKPGNG